VSEVPRGWIETTLDQVAEVRLGRQRSPKNHSGKWMRPYLRAANVTWNGLDLSDVKQMNFAPTEAETYELRPGDVLIAEASGSADEVGKPAIWRGEIPECCFQNTLIRIRSLGLLPDYVLWHCRHDAMTGRFGQAARGVGIHHLGAQRLSQWNIRVPPLVEQRRIVETIEEQFSRLDAAEKALIVAQQKLTPLWMAALRRSLRGEWPVTTVGDIAEVDAGPAFKSDFFGALGDGIRLLRGDNIEPGRLRWKDARTWPTDRLKGYEHLFISENDLILAMDRPVISTGLKLARVHPGDVPALLVQRVARIRPKGAVSTAFLYLLLQQQSFIPHLVQGQTGTQLPHITLDGIRSFPVLVPPQDDQARLVAEMDHQSSIIGVMDVSVASALRRSATLRLSILERAFAGQLVPQDPSDEPASQLLDRVVAGRDVQQRAPKARRRGSVRARTGTRIK
jgi:type I restriction enzyme, S subunit